MTNHLESLRRHSIVVADTGDIDAIARFRPRDTTTNPSLLYQAAQKPAYRALVEEAVGFASRAGGDKATQAEALMDKLGVNFGREILNRVEGRVSTEVDALLSFDTDATIAKARRLIALYEDAGLSRKRVLIKIAATWEGIRAAEQLEREGIHCNLTLLFSFAQAVACADAGVTLISPFVGRIYDWYKAARKVDDIPADEDPGVASVTKIYEYYKKFGYKTEIMGASFRKTDQIVRLAGCDLLTISPDLLGKLERTEGELPLRLTLDAAKASSAQRAPLDEKRFRWALNEDAMATEKLADGIRRFHADAEKLQAFAMGLVATRAHKADAPA